MTNFKQNLLITLTAGREPWRTDAACQGSDPWIFDGENDADILEALAYCRRCPVTAQCVEWAQRDRAFIGVAGGTTWGMSRRRNRKVDGLSAVSR